jgi:hypothetical protein
MRDFTELICLLWRLCRYYGLESSPCIMTDDTGLVLTLTESDAKKVESVARHLKILGFSELSISYDENRFSFRYSAPV